MFVPLLLLGFTPRQEVPKKGPFTPRGKRPLLEPQQMEPHSECWGPRNYPNLLFALGRCFAIHHSLSFCNPGPQLVGCTIGHADFLQQ